MQTTEVLAILRANFPELQAMGIRRLALFGSVARGEAHPDSDVDLLVEFEPPLGFDQYMDAKFRLEALLGRPVDLVTTKGLKPELRPTIEREGIRVP
jgi:predicted nucleotidyltransferase